MKKIVFICAILGLGIGIYGLWRIKQPEPAELVRKMITEKAKILNCQWDYASGTCNSFFGKKKYLWLDDEWKESEASKICSPYADKKLSDLPIECLDYFGLKK